MLGRRKVLLALLIAASTLTAFSGVASAAYRQRYSSWSYYPQRQYYYRYYYYKPYADYDGYKYHYCIHYPSQQYVYYYNPVRRVYWGRYDLEKQGYSLLAEKDRKENLSDIPESAFPEPGEMPQIPDSEDGEKVEKIAKEDLPTGDVTGNVDDLPAK